MSNKKEIPILIGALLVTLGIVGAGGWFLFNRMNPAAVTPGPATTVPMPRELQANASAGERVLVPTMDNETKLFASKAIAEGKNAEALAQLTQHLEKSPNDPEAWIYFNNLRALDHNPLQIAVVAPVGSSLNIAQEILRGAAQAQEEINQKGGIDGRFLHITIVNDANDGTLAQQFAGALIKQNQILGVVGHNASSATLSAAPTYEAGGLVLVNATSDANGITNVGDHIFRVIPQINTSAQTLVQQVGKEVDRVAVCYDSKAPDGVSFYQEFTTGLLASGGQLAPTVCDLSEANFNSQAKMAEIVASGAQGLLILPHIDRLDRAFALGDANRGRLKLYGNSPLSTIKTLEQGRGMVGLMVAIPWSSKSEANRPFAEAARKFWGGDVSWRTAATYDAVYTVANALAIAPSRPGLQKALKEPEFVSSTINGEVSFLPNGDRAGQATLVKIKPSPSHVTGYDFFPVNP
ncbi:ABC transporter substrate-binding protein [Synechocystis salina]|uniref:ABC transporter substrate-binding protein n=1 Tax=Synechocystis salina LEGE 00031 TaxID=1828736 RepID=A0ABR9VUV5_9SYNC|nr:ABC transporter substrate-binding protein [Synechocystis salina]MBE9241996.1 ABC transporter substrate-binding protein [Synechocystis salina LEGE 00041]MBE9255145.1 ABC transporter substrate-binding protein [Synechocystis salina LEGE 00031]